ncbi:hypothetical protein D3C86_1923060 [compost metagenome]
MAFLDQPRRHFPGRRRGVVGIVGIERQPRIQRVARADARFEEGFDKPGLADAGQADQPHALPGVAQDLAQKVEPL